MKKHKKFPFIVRTNLKKIKFLDDIKVKISIFVSFGVRF